MGVARVMSKAVQYEIVAEAVAACRHVVDTTAVGRRDLQHRLQRLDEGDLAIILQLKTGLVALLFGSERFGLSNQELSHCHWVMRIPTQEEHGSMNLGQAVAVCLYEMVRGKKKTAPAKTAPRKKETTSAASGELEPLTQGKREVLRDTVYVNPRGLAA